jgi:Tfp pilus assembly protein PilO
MSTTRRWGIGAGLAALVILAAGWFLLVKPQKAKVTDLHDQTTAQLQTNQTLVTKINALEAEAKNNAQEQRILEKFATQIPDTAGEPALIRAISQAAKGAGVTLVKIAPAAAQSVGGSSTAGQTLGAAPTGGALFSLPVAVSVVGVYANMESFFSAIEHLPRAFRVESFKFAPATSTPGSTDLPPNALTASIQTAVFYSTPSTTTGTASSTTTPAPGSTPATDATNPAAPAADVARNAAGETS